MFPDLMSPRFNEPSATNDASIVLFEESFQAQIHSYDLSDFPCLYVILKKSLYQINRTELYLDPSNIKCLKYWKHAKTRLIREVNE